MEKEMMKQFAEIAEKYNYVIVPKKYLEKLFNGFEQLKTDLKNARASRDKKDLIIKEMKKK